MTSEPVDDGHMTRVNRRLASNVRSDRPLAEGSIGDEVAWAVVDAEPDGIVLVDGDGSILLVNSQLEAMFGYDRGELLGRPVEHLIDPSMTGRHQKLRTSYQAQPSVRSRAKAVGSRRVAVTARRSSSRSA